MKIESFFLIFFLFCTNASLQANSSALVLTDTIIQNYHRSNNIRATKTEALVSMRIMNFRKNRLANVPLWVKNKKGQCWQGTTDENGEVIFLLPNNSSYAINIEEEEDYKKFTIPKEANYTKIVKFTLITASINEQENNDTIYQNLSQGLMPTMSRVLVNIKIADLNKKPLENEILYFQSKKNNKVYYSKTDKKGKSTLMLPKGDTYCIHSYIYNNITCKTFEESNTSRTSLFAFETISTSEFIAREKERKILLARRDSLRRVQRLRDSVRLAQTQFEHFFLQHSYEKKDFKKIEANIKKVVLKDQEAIANNKNHYSETGEEIKAMLFRNKENWKEKRIIANIDCSMYDYIDELMVWNYSNEEERRKNSYWLFNGFNYESNNHSGSDRRGIFYVPNNNVMGFFNTLDKIVNFTCRGSRLENVVEALILGAKDKMKTEDLLFIADNYSDVSDLEKLKDLKTPVHVLLTQSDYGINENYLEIAYKSGGSIHTIDEDISSNQLEALKDGQQLLIGKFTYTFYKGKFLKAS